MAMKGYSIFSRYPEAEPHHCMEPCHAQNTNPYGLFNACGVMITIVGNKQGEPSSNKTNTLWKGMNPNISL